MQGTQIHPVLVHRYNRIPELFLSPFSSPLICRALALETRNNLRMNSVHFRSMTLLWLFYMPLLSLSRDSKLGAILRECLGSLTCRAVVMIHVSNAHSRYAETLAALQLGSRVHRLRRSRRLKVQKSSTSQIPTGSSL
jgi:hypothetical protein